MTVGQGHEGPFLPGLKSPTAANITTSWGVRLPKQRQNSGWVIVDYWMKTSSSYQVLLPADARVGLGLTYCFIQNRSGKGGNDHVKAACSFPSGCCSGITDHIVVRSKISCWLYSDFQRTPLCQFSVGLCWAECSGKCWPFLRLLSY